MGVKRGFRGDNVIYRDADGKTMAVILTGGQGDAPPTAPGAVGSGAGGTLAAATYAYKYTYVKDGVESPPSSASTGVVTTGSTSKVDITVTAVTGATQYKIYGRTGGSFLLMTTLTAPTVTYADTGSATPTGAAPTADYRANFNTPYTGHGATNSVVPGLTAGTYQKI